MYSHKPATEAYLGMAFVDIPSKSDVSINIMSIGFGFSVGDFVAALELAGTNLNAFRKAGDAQSEYQELIGELLTLKTALSGSSGSNSRNLKVRNEPSWSKLLAYAREPSITSGRRRVLTTRTWAKNDSRLKSVWIK